MTVSPIEPGVANYASGLLAALGAPGTPGNVEWLSQWIETESPNEVGPGVTSYNALGVENTSGQLINFGSLKSGLATTAAYIKSDAPQLTTALQSGKATPTTLTADVYLSSWGGSPGVGSSVTDSANITSRMGLNPIQVVNAEGGYVPPGGTHTPASGVAGIPSDIAQAPGVAAAGVTSGTQAALSGAFSGVLSPLVGDLQRDVYDWAFIVFGLLLIVVGLVVTFKGTSAGQTAEKGAGAAAFA